MSILAFEIVTAGRLNRMQPRVYNAACSSDVALSGSAADITGATVTFSTAAANATALVSWFADTDATNTTAAIGSVYINVDGVDQASPATIHEQGTSNDARSTPGQQSTVTLTSAGSHTIKLRGQRVSGTGGVAVKQTHTTLRVLVIEVV